MDHHIYRFWNHVHFLQFFLHIGMATFLVGAVAFQASFRFLDRVCFMGLLQCVIKLIISIKGVIAL